jgi:outer membrane protein assembly factor BamD (BamD/ComL family)
LEEEVAALYTQALEAFQAGKHEEALSLVNRFLSSAFSGVDRGLFLRGQILEAASPVQDIKGAYSSYETLVTLYPTSVLWGQAKNRITYLNRYYFEIW